ncbi:hypothetical protein [Phytoactinopolyspora halotolerans]|uniref:Uncharacterized protein n=1 Tax=Phytoactinopolyspora halotolerans TaxID=1981512 RepID=A0A6L9S945_9ACTN|nr:hypothetical protein [Phytoactinopolyspora halotolerans]NEE01211.1 hypothetical protein [Phytoactinopolyspora halotolerans]
MRSKGNQASRGVEGKCPRWCDYDYDPGHAGPHCAFIGEIVIPSGPSYVASVTAEADGERPYCALTLGLRVGHQVYGRAVMSWDMAERLGSMLIDAKRRYAR